MERLFSEIYNRYFSIVNRILKTRGKISRKLIADTVREYGFAESLLFMLPKLERNEWELFDEDKASYSPKIKGGIKTPLSRLQRRWLKTAISDPRAGLFLDEEQICRLRDMLSDVRPLFNADDLYYYDRFRDGDDYSDDTYISCFREVYKAVKGHYRIRIEYTNARRKRTAVKVLPYRIEYSVKNDCFGVLCYAGNKERVKKHIMRISRMKSAVPVIDDTDELISCDKEAKRRKVTLKIYDERNAMERAMLQFADYRKNTMRLDDRTYRCEIYYDTDDETELLIEILSFGPMINVEGDERFIRLIKERLMKQKELLVHKDI